MQTVLQAADLAKNNAGAAENTESADRINEIFDACEDVYVAEKLGRVKGSELVKSSFKEFNVYCHSDSHNRKNLVQYLKSAVEEQNLSESVFDSLKSLYADAFLISQLDADGRPKYSKEILLEYYKKHRGPAVSKSKDLKNVLVKLLADAKKARRQFKSIRKQVYTVVNSTVGAMEPVSEEEKVGDEVDEPVVNYTISWCEFESKKFNPEMSYHIQFDHKKVPGDVLMAWYDTLYETEDTLSLDSNFTGLTSHGEPAAPYVAPFRPPAALPRGKDPVAVSLLERSSVMTENQKRKVEVEPTRVGTRLRKVSEKLKH